MFPLLFCSFKLMYIDGNLGKCKIFFFTLFIRCDKVLKHLTTWDRSNRHYLKSKAEWYPWILYYIQNNVCEMGRGQNSRTLVLRRDVCDWWGTVNKLCQKGVCCLLFLLLMRNKGSWLCWGVEFGKEGAMRLQTTKEILME